MTPPSIKTIVAAALDLPQADRAAFLLQSCGDDAGLLKEAQSLVAAAEQATEEGFLKSDLLAPAPLAKDDTDRTAPMPDPAARGAVGTMIGRYKILQLIGEGGFGHVYVAEQITPVKRRVALKIIKPGMDTKQVIARFEAERQALAMMDHPNIARVFDGGETDTGRPYFVMELVRGVPITKYCDENKLTTRQRVELLVPVCQAIQHAHQKGIIHRDIKPNNVLVTLHDGVPVPKVIDFGIAKATSQSLTDKTVYTEFRQMIGTPAYMSPEQAEMSGLDIDTRSDIYSLGVLAYELLTGLTPFDTTRLVKAGLNEIQRIIREEEPPRPSMRFSTMGEALTTTASRRSIEPSRLRKLVAGELDWIVMRAMEKDRRRRYSTAGDLAADILRHIAGEPILAAPPSAAYRMRKFVRKHGTILGSAAVVLLVLIAGIAVSMWQAIRASRAEQIAQSKTVEATGQSIEAQRQRQAAVDARKKAEEESATARRQLADSYVQNGIAAWSEKDPSLAALWFSKALKIDQGDPHRELMDRIRLGDSFRQCVWPNVAGNAGNSGRVDPPTANSLEIKKEPDGTQLVISSHGIKIKVDSTDATAIEEGECVLFIDKTSTRTLHSVTGKPLSTLMAEPNSTILASSYGGCSYNRRFVLTRPNAGGGSTLWNMSNGLPEILDGISRFDESSWSEDCKRLIVKNGNEARVWDIETLKPFGVPIRLPEFSYLGQVQNGKHVLVRDQQGRCTVWNASDGQALGVGFQPEHGSEIAELSLDGRRVLVKCNSTRSELRDPRTGDLVYSITHPRWDHPWFSDDGKWIQNKSLRWSTELTTPLNSLIRKASCSSAYGFELSSDGATLAISGKPARIWNVGTLQPTAPPLVVRGWTDHTNFVPNSDKTVNIISIDDNRSRFALRSLLDGETLLTKFTPYDEGMGGSIVALSPDGRFGILKFGLSQCVFSTTTLEVVARIVQDDRFYAELTAFTPDGRAALGRNRERQLVAWNAMTGDRIRNPDPAWLAIAEQGRLTPDRRRYIRSEDPGGYSAIRMFNLEDDKPISPAFGIELNHLGYYRLNHWLGLNGEVVATPVHDSVRLWDAQTALPVTSLLSCSFATDNIAVSPDGRSLLALSSTTRDVVFKWSIEPTRFSPDDCECMAELVSGREVDLRFGIIPIAAEKMSQAVEALRRLERESPELLVQKPTINAVDVLPTYRNAIARRLAKCQTSADRKALSAEWVYAAAEELNCTLYKEAQLLAEASLSLDDTSLAAKDHLAHAYACQGRFSEALAIYKEYAGRIYEIDYPWPAQGRVGSDLSDFSSRWPDGSQDPQFQQIVAIYERWKGVERLEQSPATQPTTQPAPVP